MNIGLIVLGLAFLFFLVVAYFASKTWHWGHVVVMAFLFLFTLVFLFLTATLMRTHNKFRPQYTKAVQDFERELEKEARLKFGDPSTPAGPGTLMGERRLARVQHATQGRTWGNVRAAKGQGGDILLNMRFWTNEGCQRVGQEDELDEIEPVADPEISGAEDAADGDVDATAAAEPASTHGILKDQYVFAFLEYPIKTMTAEEKAYYFGSGSLGGAEFADQDTKGACRVPGAYLGRFQVVDAAPQGLTVRPADPLTPAQANLLGLGQKIAWVLYEKLPIDSHGVFASAEAAKLPAMLPLQRFVQRGIPLSPPAHRAMVEEYARDGKELNGHANNLFREQQVVEFVKPYTHQVDLVVDADLPDTDKPFNAEGRAQMKSLMMKDGVAKFEIGDQATVDGVMAKMLLDQTYVKPVGKPMYSRQLKDYQFLLNNFHLKFNELSTERKTVEEQVNDLAASLNRLQEQIDKHREELELLRADQKGFEIEREQLEAYRQMLEQRLGLLQRQVQTRSFVSVTP